MYKQQQTGCANLLMSIRKGTLPMERRTFLSAIGASLLACTSLARAQSSYPKSPVRMIVPYSAGGGIDAIARLVAQGMGKILEQTFIVENRGGAGGLIGADMVARATPDGYTVLLAGNSELTITPWLQPSVNYVASRDFIPLVLISQSPNVLVGNPTFTGMPLKAAFAEAEKTTGGVTIATPGNGSPHHIAVEMLKEATGLDIIHVPYKGAGPATVAALGGEVNFALVGAPPVLPHIATNKLVALAVSQKERTPLLPDVPTLGEALEITNSEDLVAWYGLLVPTGTPADVVNKLEQAALSMLQQAETQAQFTALGTELVGMPGHQFAQRIAHESEHFRAIIQSRNLSNT